MSGQTQNSEKFDVRPFIYRLPGFVLDGLLNRGDLFPLARLGLPLLFLFGEKRMQMMHSESISSRLGADIFLKFLPFLSRLSTNVYVILYKICKSAC